MTIATTPLPDGGSIPVFGLGTWMMGERADRLDAEIATLRAGLEQGVTLIDTAEMYGNGGSEKMVGQAIAGRRDGLFLVSKVLPHNASRAGTIRACEQSLRRVGTDRLDLYLLHWRGQHPLAETVAAFEDLKASGKILRWGVSNFDTDDMAELQAITDACQANQVLYNPSRRGIEHDLLPQAQKAGMPIMAYSPIEQGRLANNRTLADIAARHQASPAQIALAWVLRQPGVVAIPKTSRPDRVAENVQALDIRLTQADLDAIDTAFPPPTRPQPLDMI
ncbi:aldo/keto reductase [Devosia sp. PTR5]|uniref:Aldo/keto reductase n=1 Tax=Devosia oryzisoli TaxID=2774138 RepID=A0A927FXU1_9HYPH|nr:aldo/keto reductase [Devosia oryzisoli]MBD8067257.1 aldo/keto reductase [Devosia oryzisoli]